MDITSIRHAVWTPYIGEQLVLQAEHGITVDQFAVAVVKDSNVVGHVPMEYSRIFWYVIKSVIATSSARSVDLDVYLK